MRARERYISGELDADGFERELDWEMRTGYVESAPQKVDWALIQARAGQVAIGQIAVGCVVFVLGLPTMIVLGFFNEHGLNGPAHPIGVAMICAGLAICCLAIVPGLVYFFIAWRRDDL